MKPELLEVIKAALKSRIAFYEALKNEAEVANGGHDFGQEALDKEHEEALDQLDDALDKVFGRGWDLQDTERLMSKLTAAQKEVQTCKQCGFYHPKGTCYDS